MPWTNEGARLALEGPGFAAANRWLAAFVGDPTDTGVEVSATGYSRLMRTPAQMPVTNNQVRFSMFEWEDSANASWGTPTYVAVMDAATDGNVLAYATVSVGDIPTGSRVFGQEGNVSVEIPLV